MQREHGFFIMALIEPFQNARHIQRYTRRLGMDTAVSNINGKIWLFFDVVVEWELLMDTEQQVTIKVYHQGIGKHIMMIFVYVKYSSLERFELWDNLYCLASNMELPWPVGGDFNMILHEDKKIGGLPVYPSEYENFAFCVNSNGLFDLGYKRSLVTWWNDRPNAESKLKRVKTALSQWSKVRYGDIFKQLAIREDIVRIKEMLFEEEPTIDNKIILQKA
ncbi:uncharacterized protein [Nicotiana tomentosiformis]|uniref:uncharacterized protein n=1 Tax=Nicotiana tomentosiformis TaxID=4098 RepID=UPI00388C4ACA